MVRLPQRASQKEACKVATLTSISTLDHHTFALALLAPAPRSSSSLSPPWLAKIAAGSSAAGQPMQARPACKCAGQAAKKRRRSAILQQRHCACTTNSYVHSAMSVCHHANTALLQLLREQSVRCNLFVVAACTRTVRCDAEAGCCVWSRS